MISLNKLLIDGEDYIEYATLTLQGQETLDESLDLNYIELKGTNIDVPFKPFLDVEIHIHDGYSTKIIKRLVESDTVTEVTGNGTYNHDLLFIEETKWLERLFVEKTVRQPLIHDYASIEQDNFVTTTITYGQSSPGVGVIPITRDDSGNASLIPIIITGKDYEIYNPIYLLYQIQKQLNFEMYIASNGTSNLTATLDIKNEVGESILSSPVVTTISELQDIPTDKFTINIKDEGSYRTEITLTGNAIGALDLKGNTVFDFSTIIQSEPRENYTIRNVINQLLETCITLRESEEPLFKIAEPRDYAGASEDYRKQVQSILDSASPEFTFSKMSLFEALKTIGDYAHFIPRLQDRKIFFDLLGQMEDGGVQWMGQHYSNVANQGSNDFCNALDSQVNNLTNMDDEAQGSVITPDGTGYRTLRTDVGNVQITDQNIIIPTEDNIEKIIKLEIGYLSDNKTIVGDITPFVYEEDEYKTLSSYTDTYPTSKMYAIKYKQGSKNITELSFKRENAVSPALEKLAIKNIIYKKLNKPINAWENFWENEDVFKLQYRLTYIPSTNTKVTQFRQNPDDMSSKPLYIAYNQSASKVSSNAYGENLKGTIAKLGNIAKTKMYILPSFEFMPKCGTLFDKDYYISVVKYEVYPTFIKCEVGLSKNYNNKSAYVEINSQLEFFEYNRNITIDRYVVYEDFCEISDDVIYEEQPTKSMITSTDGMYYFEENFLYQKDDFPISYPVTSVVAQGFSNRSGPLTEVILPVISLGVGNSLLFAFHYEDTISAGSRAFDSGSGRFQSFVKYTDIYGEVDKLKLNFGINYSTLDDYDTSVKYGDVIPATSYPDVSSGENVSIVERRNQFFNTEGDNIVLRKGVGEAIHFTYQLHFVTKNQDIVIGSGLTRKSIFTTDEPKKFKLYALPNKINKFETKIDLTNAVEVGTLKIEKHHYDNKWTKLKTDNVVPNGNYKAWAIVQTWNNSNDLILGKNIDFNGGETLNLPTFTFKRRIK